MGLGSYGIDEENVLASQREWGFVDINESAVDLVRKPAHWNSKLQNRPNMIKTFVFHLVTRPAELNEMVQVFFS